MINLSSYSLKELEDLRDKKIIEKMKLDKFFSMFLDAYGDGLNADNIDNTNPLWKLYRGKLKEYNDVETTINRTKFHIDQKCLKAQTNFHYT